VAAAPTVRPYAAPTAAPPSVSEVGPAPVGPTTKEPPKINESRYRSRQEASVGQTVEKSRDDCCRVEFLNLSQRDLVLKVDGAARTLGRGEKLTMTVKKQFVWQIVGSEPELERVPADKTSLSIVIRR
jgi:hypothetical protein